jgi:hypothetical protein
MDRQEFTAKYEDVLQNLEFPIVTYYRQHSELIDGEALTAIETLIRIYGAEAQGKQIGARPVRGIASQVMTAVQQVCEWRLGREQPADIAGSLPPSTDMSIITVNELVDCLKQIQSSIKFWSKQGGRQGYLKYVNGFFP